MSDERFDDERAESRSDEPPPDQYYRGVITRVYYGSESGTLRADASGREYRFKFPFVDVRGPIPRIDGLREGMRVGFDLGWTSRGLRVSLIKVYD